MIRNTFSRFNILIKAKNLSKLSAVSNFSRKISLKNNRSFSICPSLSLAAPTNNNNIKHQYEMAASETLESLTERFDYLAEELGDSLASDYDVSYSNGVLNVKLGEEQGTYVLNKQTPNLQIWLSSPVSGPKRFDLINNQWIYKRTGETLHDTLSKEISGFFGKRIDFSKCAYSGNTTSSI
jgi:frataxin